MVERERWSWHFSSSATCKRSKVHIAQGYPKLLGFCTAKSTTSLRLLSLWRSGRPGLARFSSPATPSSLKRLTHSLPEALLPPNVPEGLEDGMSVKVGGFEIHGVPAAHEERDLDDQGRDRFMGYVVKVGHWTVYHSGDTVLYDGMVERLWPFHVDVALLPINGRAPERRVAGNLDGREAAWLANDIGAKLAIPCHYEMFAFNTASPEQFMAECERVGQPYKILRAGERWSGQ